MADYAPDPYPSGAGVEDFYGTMRRLANYSQGPGTTSKGAAYDAAHSTFANLRAGGYNLPIGMANLGQILASQGKTDPMRLNQQLTGISRDTQAQQLGLQEMFARSGLGGSGLLPGLTAAQGAAGTQQRSQAIAQENQLQEARKREDLGLLYNLIIGPSIQGYGINQGVAVGQQQVNQQEKASQYAMYAQLLGTLAAACWVAREVYGIRNPKWWAFRKWMLRKAPSDLRAFYLQHGPRIAEFLRLHPAYKPPIRKAMDRILVLEG